MNFLKSTWLLLLGVVNPIHGGWIDVDTPEDKRTVRSFVDGTVYELVMSDEFNVPNRTFKDGEDPMWTALDKSDDDFSASGGGSLQFYNSSTVTTKDGSLRIQSKHGYETWEQFDEVDEEFKKVEKFFQSGMLQSWNKFCFTGGIVEMDIILPGEPTLGGLWPAVWMMGNLGRATYETSTNMIWPWSFDTCDRKLQESQYISACNKQNHFGLHPNQGRGATEIDFIEMMAGDPGPLPATDPVITYPYVDMTLQVAPGVLKNRPQPGAQPIRHVPKMINGHPTGYVPEVWYDGLEMYGNTSINPYFYGTYLGETSKGEPVQRNKNQAFQADAVGSMHQVTDSHFRKMHSFRMEWQPGDGGRLDWFTKAYKANGTMDDSVEGDGNGEEWVKVYTLKDESLKNLTGAKIPIEPTYLILNTAISSTWGFPFQVPDWCPKCYDCNDPKCACSFNPGFCEMLSGEGVTFEIDHIRVYQSKNHSAHVGQPHTVGCDPVEYPTREFINGNTYRYCRIPPFDKGDTSFLKKVRKGGGKCETDQECGGAAKVEEFTDVENIETKTRRLQQAGGRGVCIPVKEFKGLHSTKFQPGEKVCNCSEGFTGPNCLALDHKDDEMGAYELKMNKKIFGSISKPFIPPLFICAVGILVVMFVGVMITQAVAIKKQRSTKEYVSGGDTPSINNREMKRPGFKVGGSNLVITGRSV